MHLRTSIKLKIGILLFLLYVLSLFNNICLKTLFVIKIFRYKGLKLTNLPKKQSFVNFAPVMKKMLSGAKVANGVFRKQNISKI